MSSFEIVAENAVKEIKKSVIKETVFAICSFINYSHFNVSFWEVGCSKWKHPYWSALQITSEQISRVKTNICYFFIQRMIYCGVTVLIKNHCAILK